MCNYSSWSNPDNTRILAGLFTALCLDQDRDLSGLLKVER